MEDTVGHVGTVVDVGHQVGETVGKSERGEGQVVVRTEEFRWEKG